MEALATKELLELVLKHLTDRIALGVLFLSGITLVLNLFINPVHSWVYAHPAWLYIGILGPICYLPTRPILERWNEWETRQKEQRKRREELQEQHKKVGYLTRDEENILAGFILTGVRSKWFPSNDIRIRGLEKEGFLYALPGVPIRIIDSHKAFNIQDWVIDYYKAQEMQKKKK